MFKLRKKRNPLVTLRTEDLQVGDKFVYDNAILEVLDIHQHNGMMKVRLGSNHPEFRLATRQVELYPELLITVERY
jgi:hypothetical protein